MDKIERNMKGIQTLVKIGMKLMIDIQKHKKSRIRNWRR